MAVANFALTIKGNTTFGKIHFGGGNDQFISISVPELNCSMDRVAEKAMRIFEIAVDNGIINVDIEKPIKGRFDVEDLEAYFPVSIYLDPTDGPTWIHAGVSQDRKNHLLSCGFKCMDPDHFWDVEDD